MRARTRSSFELSRGQVVTAGEPLQLRQAPLRIDTKSARPCSCFRGSVDRRGTAGTAPTQGGASDAAAPAAAGAPDSPLHTRRRGLAVRLLPRNDGVPQHADPLDLSLDHVAGLEVERGGVLAEARDTAH